MKFIKVREIFQHNEWKSRSDLITLDVLYEDGNTGVLACSRARYDRMNFQELLTGKTVTMKDLNRFRDLCVAEEQEERSWDED